MSNMLPEPIPILKGKVAKEFIENDKKPLTKEQKEILAKSIEIFKQHPYVMKNDRQNHVEKVFKL